MSNILLWKLKKEEHEHEKGAIATAELSFMSFVSLFMGLVAYEIATVSGVVWLVSLIISGVIAICVFLFIYAVVKGMRNADSSQPPTR